MRHMHRLSWLCVIFACALSAQNSSSPQRDVKVGEITPKVQTVAKPDQSYALYLPSGYTTGKKWPIIYMFDPSANGLRPVQKMKAAAEKYGFVVAASNNSRNGSWSDSFAAANAVWEDTHGSIAIDTNRQYLGGFSGGGRVAAHIAQNCNCARGIFLDGAGFGLSSPPSADKTKFGVFELVGTSDFNYGEMSNLDTQLESLGVAHFLQRFEGTHEWAAEPMWEEALAWAAIQEMKDGLRPRDNAVITAELQAAIEREKKREAAQPLYALQEYKETAAEFNGLADTAPIKERIAALENSEPVHAAQKQEKADLEKEKKITTDIFQSTDKLRNARREDEREFRADAMSRISGLRHDADKEKKPELQRVLMRAVGSVYMAMMETSSELMDKHDYRPAEFYLQLAGLARPDWSWTYLRLAECHAEMGDNKNVVKDLMKARETGSSVDEISKLVKSNPKIAKLVDDAQMQKIAAMNPTNKAAD